MDTDRRADWMTRADDDILSHIGERGASTPKKTANAIEAHPKHVSRRLSVLLDYGLVEKLARGVYSLTDDGESYLRGDLDASTLSRSDATDSGPESD